MSMDDDVRVEQRSVTRRRVLAALAAVPALPLIAGPLRKARAATTEEDDLARLGGRWECTFGDCEPYVYDPRKGDPTQDIPPGTPFAALPDSWICPICGHEKGIFVPE